MKITKETHNRLKDMEGGISGLEDKIDEMDNSVKESVKCKQIPGTNIRNVWDSMIRTKLWMTGTERETQAKAQKTRLTVYLDYGVSKVHSSQKQGEQADHAPSWGFHVLPAGTSWYS